MMDRCGFILSFYCDDRPGIVAGVTSLFAELGYTITESSQFQDPESARFFMRTEYEPANPDAAPSPALRERFSELAQAYGMVWDLVPKADRMRVVVAVSKWGHCLNRLLNTWKYRNMPVEIVGVFSNHEDLRSMTEWYGVDYRYLPVSNENRSQQEQAISDLISERRADLVVLARYMQVLSDDLCRELSGRAINIHHSFLPGFKGARPYHQAYAKGVKLIGATAHYVTTDLDEGPIIEQAVKRVSHTHTPAELIEMGRDIEATVLNSAVKWHAEGRVMLNGDKTVVFDR